MMMKSKKTNKKLALMVGMALSAGIIYGVAPSDALAADVTISYDAEAEDGKYRVGSSGYSSLDEALVAAFESNTVESSETATIKLDADNVLAQELAGREISVTGGATVKVQNNDGSATYYTMKSGSGGTDTATVSYTQDGVKVGGVLGSLDVKMQDNASASIDLSGVTTSGSITVDASELTAGEAEKVLNIKSSEGGVTVGTLTLTDGVGASVTGGNVTVTNLTLGDKSSLAADAGHTVTVNSAVELNGTETITLNNVALAGNVTVGENATVNGGNVTISSGTTTLNGTIALTGKLDASVISGPTVGNNASIKAAGGIALNDADLSSFAGTLDAGAGELEVDTLNLSAFGGTLSAGTLSVDTLTVDGGIGGVSGLQSLKVGTAFTNSGDAINIALAGDVELPGAVTLGDSSGNILGISGNNVSISGAVSGSGDISATGGLILTGGITMADNVNVSGATVAIGTGGLDMTAGGSVTAGELNVEGALTTGAGTISADTINATGAVTIADGTTLQTGSLHAEGALTVAGADTATLSADTIKVDGAYSNTAGTVNVGTLDLSGAGASIVADSKVNAKILAVNKSCSTVGNLTANGVQKVIVYGLSGSDIDTDTGLLTDNDLRKAINKAVTGDEETNVIVVDGTAVEGALNNAQNTIENMETKTKAEGGLSDTLAANGVVAKYASADPFATKLPSASEIAALASDNDINTRLGEYHDSLAEAKAAAEALGNTALANEYAAKLANTAPSASGQAAKLTAAVQQAGKTAAAPAVTSARAATAITTVLTNNVVTRTAEIRGFASAVDEGRPEPDKMWFQYKHTNMDVDGGDVYSKSTINTNNFQLGYDTQIGTNDYLGAYIGTTTGNADFNGPARSGRIDIDNSFDFGVYGTHMLPNDQYIDYMVHTGKFDSEYDSSKWGTTDTGAMVGYGAKIAQGDRLTLNPYIQLAYDKISVDSYATRAGNVIKSDDSNNWTAKLGMNLIDASGLYGGVAYSRGLSGSYNAYINGVAMPTSDYNANVLYLSLGYRASMAKNAVLDLSMEKTFMDYKGWTAAGKVNFYF